MEIALRPKEKKSAMESGLELMRRMQGGLPWGTKTSFIAAPHAPSTVAGTTLAGEEGGIKDLSQVP